MANGTAEKGHEKIDRYSMWILPCKIVPATHVALMDDCGIMFGQLWHSINRVFIQHFSGPEALSRRFSPLWEYRNKV